jgi:hypothetical protein
VAERAHILILQGRFKYLEALIEAKRKLGFETQYNEQEHAALDWALDRLWPEPAEPQAVVQGDDLA